LRDQVGLKRLTEVYKWLNPGLDESEVFEMQRENIFKLAQTSDDRMSWLPQAIRIPKAGAAISTKVFNSLAKQSKKIFSALPTKSKLNDIPKTRELSPEAEAYNRLPAAMEVIESMVESYNRLDAYESEVGFIQQLGMSFNEWQQLSPPSESQVEEAEYFYLTVS
jgi:hypothetical protein